MSRRTPRALKSVFYIINWTQVVLGWFYLACRMWVPGIFAVGTAIAVRVWFEWATERRGRTTPALCDARVHRDFTDGAEIRCTLPAGHAAHRNGTRQWTR